MKASVFENWVKGEQSGRSLRSSAILNHCHSLGLVYTPHPQNQQASQHSILLAWDSANEYPNEQTWVDRADAGASSADNDDRLLRADTRMPDDDLQTDSSLDVTVCGPLQLGAEKQCLPTTEIRHDAALDEPSVRNERHVRAKDPISGVYATSGLANGLCPDYNRLASANTSRCSFEIPSSRVDFDTHDQQLLPPHNPEPDDAPSSASNQPHTFSIPVQDDDSDTEPDSDIESSSSQSTIVEDELPVAEAQASHTNPRIVVTSSEYPERGIFISGGIPSFVELSQLAAKFHHMRDTLYSTTEWMLEQGPEVRLLEGEEYERYCLSYHQWSIKRARESVEKWKLPGMATRLALIRAHHGHTRLFCDDGPADTVEHQAVHATRTGSPLAIDALSMNDWLASENTHAGDELWMRIRDKSWYKALNDGW